MGVSEFIIVILEVETLLNGPVAEFDEQDHAAAIFVSLAEHLLGVGHVDAPLFKFWLGLLEFRQRYSSVIVGVDSVEGHPIFVVLSEELQKEAEFAA